MKSILFKFLLPLLSCVFGLIIGVIVRDFPLFVIEYKLKITDIIGNLSTISIGIFVPIIVKKMIDDLRSVKSVVLTEVDAYRQSLKSVYDIFEQCHVNGKITRANKDNISFAFNLTDDHFEKMKMILKGQFNDKLDNEIGSIYLEQNKLWKIMTGHEVTKSTINKIPAEVYKSAKVLNESIELKVLELKNKIHKL